MRSVHPVITWCSLALALVYTDASAQPGSVRDSVIAQQSGDDEDKPASTGVSTGSRSLDLLMKQQGLPPVAQPQAAGQKAATGASSAAAQAPGVVASGSMRDAMIREALQAGLIQQEAVEAKMREEAAERSKRASTALERASKVQAELGGQGQPAADVQVPTGLVAFIKAFVSGVIEYRYWILGGSVAALALALARPNGKSGRAAPRPREAIEPTVLRTQLRRSRRR